MNRILTLLAALFLPFLAAADPPPTGTPASSLVPKSMLPALDVRNFQGVVGDGTNDDTAGLQAAADAAVAAKLPLFFGPVSVRYKISDYIIIDGSIPAIFGTGMDDLSKSIIRQSDATKGGFIVRATGGAPSNNYIRFHDLRIEGISNITTAAADTKGIWVDSITVGEGPAVTFHDEVDVERVYISGFTWGILGEKWSNSIFTQAAVMYCYNAYEIEGDNNNSLTFQNCFANEITNIAWRINGTNTNCTMRGCEAGGRGAGNGAKALVVTNGKVVWEGANLEDFTGIRAPDTGDTTPGIIEAGINGEIHLSDITFLNGAAPINGYSYTGALPMLMRQYNGGGSATRSRMLGFTAGLPTVKLYRTYTHRFRFEVAPTNGGEGAWVYSDHTFTGTPTKFRGIDCELYHEDDAPAASESRAGAVFATYEGSDGIQKRYVVGKISTGTWENIPITPTLTDNSWIGNQSFTGLPTYADNDAALVAGLPGDRMYRTSAGALMIVKTFLPTDLAGLRGWWVAADGGPKKTGGTAAADGEIVSSWTDLSGNGKTLTRAEATCLFDADGGPGGTGPAVLMGGASLSVAWGASLADPWVILVVKHDADTGMLIDSEASGRVYASKYASALLSMSAGSIVNGLTVPNDAWGIQLMQWGTTGRYSWSNSTDTAVNSGTNTMENLVIGRDYTNSSDVTFHVAEIIAGTGDLSDTDSTKLKNYLAAKYGITLN